MAMTSMTAARTPVEAASRKPCPARPGGGGGFVRAILTVLGFIAPTAYARCRVAGEADRMEGLRR